MTDTTPKEETPRCERCGYEMEETFTRTVDADGNAEVAWVCPMEPEQCELMATLRDGVVPHSALREAKSIIAALRSEVEALRKRNEELGRQLEEAKAAIEQPVLSCLCCGASMSDKGRYAAVQHLVFKGVVICQECKGASEHYREVLHKYHMTDKAFGAVRAARDESRSQFRASEASVIALREALEKAQWCIARAMLKGLDMKEESDAIEKALSNTSATAQQVRAEIERDALEKGVAKMEGIVQAIPINDFSVSKGDSAYNWGRYFVDQFRAAILGGMEKNQ